MPKGVFQARILEDAAPGDIDAQRLMEQLHARWTQALTEDGAPAPRREAAQGSTDKAAMDPERARRSAERARAVIAQKDRARAIIARMASGEAAAQGLSRRAG